MERRELVACLVLIVCICTRPTLATFSSTIPLSFSSILIAEDSFSDMHCYFEMQFRMPIAAFECHMSSGIGSFPVFTNLVAGIALAARLSAVFLVSKIIYLDIVTMLILFFEGRCLGCRFECPRRRALDDCLPDSLQWCPFASLGS